MWEWFLNWKTKPIEPEDLDCNNPIANIAKKLILTIRVGRKVAEITGAVSGWYLLREVDLTVNQIDMFLKAMPFELTYADDMTGSSAQQRPSRSWLCLPNVCHLNLVAHYVSCSRLTSTSSYEKCGMVISGTLRNGNQEYVHADCSRSPGRSY